MSLDPNDTAYASFMQILHTRMETRNLPWDPEYAKVNIKARIREPWSMFERAPVVVDARNWQSILEEARKGNLRGFAVYSEYLR